MELDGGVTVDVGFGLCQNMREVESLADALRAQPVEQIQLTGMLAPHDFEPPLTRRRCDRLLDKIQRARSTKKKVKLRNLLDGYGYRYLEAVELLVEERAPTELLVEE